MNGIIHKVLSFIVSVWLGSVLIGYSCNYPESNFVCTYIKHSARASVAIQVMLQLTFHKFISN